jgi:hypothetical protein
MKQIRKILLFILLGSILTLMLFEYQRHGGKILAESRNRTILGHPTIKIRELKSSFLDDNPPYRFEYYCYDYPEIWSCQTYEGRSYTAQSAQIEWASDGSATVFLDHEPKFTCKNGVWADAVHK